MNKRRDAELWLEPVVPAFIIQLVAVIWPVFYNKLVPIFIGIRSLTGINSSA